MQSIDEILDEIFYQSEMHHWEALVRIAFVQEREAREKAEAERDEARKAVGVKHNEANRYVNEMIDAKARADRIKHETLARCAALCRDKANKHGWNYHLPSVGRELAAAILALGE